MMNGAQEDAIIADSDENHDYHAATGVAILSLSPGNAVYIKTHPTVGNGGSLLSSGYARSSLSGFLINWDKPYFLLFFL